MPAIADQIARFSDNDASLSHTGEAPPPRITWRGVLIAGTLWGLYALFYTAVISAAEQTPFATLLMGQVVSTAILALYSIPIWWLTVRKMDSWAWGWVLGVHLVLAPAYAWGSLESYLIISDTVFEVGLREELTEEYIFIAVTHLTIYAVQFAIYHLVRTRQRKRWREWQAMQGWARAREQELAALKAQINPHFLFNTLNSISSTLKQYPDRAREMIAGLSQMLRYVLDASDHDLVPLRDEITFAQTYLNLERHRFSDRLQTRYDIAINDAELNTPIPPMTLQPLVENAIKHGIAPQEEGGTVTLHVTSDNGWLHVTVDDTGAGSDTDNPVETSEGTGLPNTNERLVHAYGPKAALHTEPLQNGGFSISFSVPKSAPTD